MNDLEIEMHDLAVIALGRALTESELAFMRAAVACHVAAAALPFTVATTLLRLFD